MEDTNMGNQKKRQNNGRMKNDERTNNGLIAVAYQSIIRLHRMTCSITVIAFLSIPFSQVAKNHLILVLKISVLTATN
jgi:hypothetical protein